MINEDHSNVCVRSIVIIIFFVLSEDSSDKCELNEDNIHVCVLSEDSSNVSAK